MELTEEIVEVEFWTRIFDKFLPVFRCGSVLFLKVWNNLWEVPGKSQYIGMLLLIEFWVDSEAHVTGI